MDILTFKGVYGLVGIPAEKITGFCEVSPGMKNQGVSTFIATGADGADGAENGFYVVDDFATVHELMRMEGD
jgi:hypothetical protein